MARTRSATAIGAARPPVDYTLERFLGELAHGGRGVRVVQSTWRGLGGAQCRC